MRERMPAGAVQSGVNPLERPRELEDGLNFHLFHPLSMRLARALGGTFVTPNMVSIAGGLMIVLAAIAYSVSASWVGVLLGLFLHLGWHVLDGADGDLARLTGRASSNGEVVDGVCDYLGHIVLYLALGALLAKELGAAAWWIMLAAGLARVAQAIHYEAQRRQYQFWVYAKSWLRVSQSQNGQLSGPFGGLAKLYIRLSEIMAPGGRHVDALVEQSAGQMSDSVRQIARREMAPVLRWSSPLSANYRTIALGASMLAGSPTYFFVFEAVVLTMVLIISIKTAAAATRRIYDQLVSRSSR
jgi:phosphatidylglycerophosphate synthase